MLRTRGLSIMSGKGTGKDALTAWVIMWFIVCFDRCKVPCVSPRMRHTKTVLWAEVTEWRTRRQSKTGDYLCKCKDFFINTSERIAFKYRPNDEKNADNWSAFPRPASPNISEEQKKEVLAGLHAQNMLIVCDEAAGIPEAVFDPLETTLTAPNNWCLLIFNPTRKGCFAVNTHQGANKDQWIRLQWNAEKSDIVTKEHIDAVKVKYGGRDTNGYRVNVLGLPPNAADGSLIPWDWVAEAVDREIPPHPEDPIAFGVDVGGGGDPSAIVIRQGPIIIDAFEYPDMRSEELIEEVVEMYDEYRDSERFGKAESGYKLYGGIFVDAIGVGKGVFDLLRAQLPKVYGIMSSNTPMRTDLFARKRDELWWKCRTLFENREISIRGSISQVIKEKLLKEFSLFKYDKLDSGKVKVESKKRLRKRVGKSDGSSPNLADAFILTLDRTDASLRALQKKTFERRPNRKYRSRPTTPSRLSYQAL